ncbi:MAG TPA: glycosyltransferase [Flavilitoribacter sp.]|nr:glycosyltransferase [Flavilitoribacter sp.]HMQ86904.1 glycosyltransferase [Flavilitoribacter sp.]
MLLSCLLLTGLILATAAQFILWLGVYARLVRYDPDKEPAAASEEGVSVVICARNEAENLRKNLPHILNQNYRSFEVIVVDDDSSDESEKIILSFQKNYPILRPVLVKDKKQPGKKAALSLGIKEARYDKLLLTDADCRPASSEWINRMQAAFTGNVNIVLGFGPYLTHSGFLNRFIRFETLFTAIQYLSLALLGLPYMGVGRNLAYRKSLFDRVGGFKRHGHIAYGDDDLFVSGAARGGQTAIVLQPEAFTFSEAKSDWRGFYFQKSRHLSAGVHYRPVHQALLGVSAASHFLHYACFAALLLSGDYFLMTLSLFIARMAVVTWLYSRVSERFRESNLLPWIPLLDAALALYYFLFSPVLLIKTGNYTSWKQ